MARRRLSCPPPSPNLVRPHPIEHYRALRDSAPCLSRAVRRTPGNTILSQPYRRRVSTDSLNREGSQLAASLGHMSGISLTDVISQEGTFYVMYPTTVLDSDGNVRPSPISIVQDQQGPNVQFLDNICRLCNYLQESVKLRRMVRGVLNMLFFVSFCNKSQFDTNVVRHLSYFF